MPARPDAATAARLARDLRTLHLASLLDLRPPLPDAGVALHAAVADLDAAVAVAPRRTDQVLDHLARLDAHDRERALAHAAGPVVGRPSDDLCARHDAVVAAAADRRRRGAWYTPPALAAALVGWALAPDVSTGQSRGGADGVPPRRVVDPACGTGRVVLAAHRHLVDAGEQPGPGQVCGVDADPDAVEVLRLALWLELADPAVGPERLVDAVVHGDALPVATTSGGAPPIDWTAAFPDVLTPAGGAADGAVARLPGGFDAVVGNPPFANPLRGGGPVDRAAAAALAAHFDGDVRGYANPAVAFLALALDLARPDGGRVALVQPLSTLAARDAGPVRRRLLERAHLEHLWVDGRPLFDASVRTCAVVARRTGPGPAWPSPVGPDGDGPPTDAAAHPDEVAPAGGPPRSWVGLPPREAPPRPGATAGSAARADDAPWGPLVAGALGIPLVPGLRAGAADDDAGPERIGRRWPATADFRDQYYGLAAALVDAPDGAAPDRRLAPLATSGLIGPGACWWGQRPVRLHKRPWTAPAVDLDVLGADPAMARWAEARRVPKVLVATQGPVVEAFADPDGRWLPSVPVLTVAVDPDACWHAAAALVSPATAAWAAAHRLGAALQPGHVAIAARHVAEVPLPVDRIAWDDAAACLADAQRAAGGGDVGGWRTALRTFGRAAVAAAGLGPTVAAEVEAWWAARLPEGGDGHRRSGRLGP